MALHRNIYSFVYRGEDCPESKDVIWIHHDKKNDLQSPIVAEIWIKNEWRPFLWGDSVNGAFECCCCGSPFVRDEGKASAAMRAASNVAKGEFSFVAGHKSLALGQNSIAIGNNLIADFDNQIVIGSYNDRSDICKFAIGIGKSDDRRINALSITESGKITFYNVADGKHYSLSQIINAIGQGGGGGGSVIIDDNFIFPGDIIDIVPDI